MKLQERSIDLFNYFSSSQNLNILHSAIQINNISDSDELLLSLRNDNAQIPKYNKIGGIHEDFYLGSFVANLLVRMNQCLEKTGCNIYVPATMISDFTNTSLEDLLCMQKTVVSEKKPIVIQTTYNEIEDLYISVNDLHLVTDLGSAESSLTDLALLYSKSQNKKLVQQILANSLPILENTLNHFRIRKGTEIYADVFSDCVEGILESLNLFSDEVFQEKKANFETYLYRKFYWKIMDNFRHDKYYSKYFGSSLDDEIVNNGSTKNSSKNTYKDILVDSNTDANPMKYILREELYRIFFEELDKLTPQNQEMINMFVFDCYTYEEIAELVRGSRTKKGAVNRDIKLIFEKFFPKTRKYLIGNKKKLINLKL